ncbi:MAG TPA: LytR C-terminal domain-containing protein [Candidatus Saccharimonadales bacterium]|nr:LytR C-terminal domain-containing protein [Candidatus Saccharimonadales bacterium]
MYKKKNSKQNDKSIKTFISYFLIVFFAIIISLSIKAFFVIRQSRFDGKNINIAITQKNRVTGILGIDSENNSLSLLKIRKENLSVDSIGRDLGIIIDARINTDSDISNQSAGSIFAKALFKKDSISTNLTFFDLSKLILYTKNTSIKNYRADDIIDKIDGSNSDKIIADLFKNEIISSENVSIAIVNATDQSGLGKRLERCLTNIGANVVDVSTPHSKEALSRIEYSGENTYTLNKLKKILKFPVIKNGGGKVASIVIVIGQNMKNTTAF